MIRSSIFDCENVSDLYEMGFTILKPIDNSFIKNVKKNIEEILDSYEYITKKTSLPLNIPLFDSYYERNMGEIDVNKLRMYMFELINSNNTIKNNILSSIKNYILNIIGPDIVVQNKINISIVPCGDSASALPIHIDYHTGESLYQSVLWIPLVDIVDKEGIFILPPSFLKKYDYYNEILVNKGREALFQELKDHLIWPKINCGEILLFSPNNFHGSISNFDCSNKIRWSLNFRIKSALTPVSAPDKGVGNFYEPYNLGVFTNIGLNL
jgi:sporadic carbohydrate cluster 2OG-Fe(II) oxygenase